MEGKLVAVRLYRALTRERWEAGQVYPRVGGSPEGGRFQPPNQAVLYCSRDADTAAREKLGHLFLPYGIVAGLLAGWGRPITTQVFVVSATMSFPADRICSARALPFAEQMRLVDADLTPGQDHARRCIALGMAALEVPAAPYLRDPRPGRRWNIVIPFGNSGQLQIGDLPQAQDWAVVMIWSVGGREATRSP